jgi:hypothetical protein
MLRPAATTAVKTSLPVFWGATSRVLVCVYRRFKGAYSSDVEAAVMSPGICSQVYTTLPPKVNTDIFKAVRKSSHTANLCHCACNLCASAAPSCYVACPAYCQAGCSTVPRFLRISGISRGKVLRALIYPLLTQIHSLTNSFHTF